MLCTIGYERSRFSTFVSLYLANDTRCEYTLCPKKRHIFFRVTLCVNAAYAVMRCLCVYVTFVHCVKTNKDIFKFFSQSGSHAILVFPHQTAWQYSGRNPPNGGVECRWKRLKSRNQ